MMTRTRPVVIALTAFACLLHSNMASAGTFDGWCFPFDGCDGPYKITNDRFLTRESTCVMSSPVSVDDMKARLYRVHCRADHGDSFKRMFFSFYDAGNGSSGVLAVDHYGAVKLTRC